MSTLTERRQSVEVMRGALAGSLRQYEPAEEDAAINALIERRGEDANREEETWKEYEREHHEDRDALLRRLWVIHHRKLARLHARISEANAAKAAALADPGEGDR